MTGSPSCGATLRMQANRNVYPGLSPEEQIKISTLPQWGHITTFPLSDIRAIV